MSAITEVFNYVMLNGYDIIAAVTMIIAGASALANFTPTDADNKLLAKIASFVDMLALNFKKKA